MLPPSSIPELEDVIQHGSPERLHLALRRITTLFLEGASRFNDAHVRVFDAVLGSLVEKADARSRAELSERLAAVANAPLEVVRKLASDADISVAGPVLERSPRLADANLLEIAKTSEAHRMSISRRITEPLIQSSAFAAPAGPPDFTAGRPVPEALRDSQIDQTKLVELARSGRYEDMVATLAEICSVPREAVERLMAGERPDPVLVLCRSAGFEWPAAKAVISACPRMGTAALESAQSNFERLSAETAHRVMRFWRYRRTDDRRRAME
jgi:uncharacterized protein (DUF2336 family)